MHTKAVSVDYKGHDVVSKLVFRLNFLQLIVREYYLVMGVRYC